MSSTLRISLLTTVLAVSALAVVVQRDVHQPLLTLGYRTQVPSAPTIVFIVLDTVRADRLSACGYDRPTSPTLDQLVADGASLSCRASAPGAWTLPSHASFFTGLPPWVHGSDHVTATADTDVDIFGVGALTRPLPEHFPTLAEQLKDRGYQTAAVSANLVVSDTTGLLRGFDYKRAAGAVQWRNDKLVAEVRDTLREVKRDGTPLFLFVNIIDAHQPFDAIPSGVSWAPPQEVISYHPAVGDDPFEAFVNHALTPADRADFETRVSNGYDWGVTNSDATLAGVLDTLAGHGWMQSHRLVITSDHGEFLGEHGLLDHGVYLYEPLTRVPLLYHSTENQVDLPEPVSATESYALALDGTLKGLEIMASAQPNPFWQRLSRGRIGDVVSAASWHGTQKWLASNGQTRRFDLERDPLEQEGTPVETPASLTSVLERGVETMSAPVVPNDDITEMLIQAGYLDR